MQILKN